MLLFFSFLEYRAGLSLRECVQMISNVITDANEWLYVEWLRDANLTECVGAFIRINRQAILLELDRWSHRGNHECRSYL